MKSYSIFCASLMTLFSLVNIPSFEVTIRLQNQIPSTKETPIPHLNFPSPQTNPLIIA